MSDRIKLYFKVGPELQSAIKKHEKYIEDETLATQLNLMETEQRFSFEIDGYEFSLSIEKDSS